VLLLERVLELVARGDHRAHVAIVEGGEQRGGVLRFLESPGDGQAQAGHLDAFFAALALRGGFDRLSLSGRSSCGRSRRGGFRLCRGDHVFLGQAAVLAGALDAGGVDPGFEHRAAHCGGERGGGIAGRWRFGFGHGVRGGRDGRVLALGHRLGPGGGRAVLDRRDHRADRDIIADLGDLLAHHPGNSRGDFDRDLVGLQTGDRLVERNRFAGLLEPFADGRFGD